MGTEIHLDTDAVATMIEGQIKTLVAEYADARDNELREAMAKAIEAVEDVLTQQEATNIAIRDSISLVTDTVMMHIQADDRHTIPLD